jgi:hypothetical protein
MNGEPLYVAPSLVPNAGLGLFANTTFNIGERITDYSGRFIHLNEFGELTKEQRDYTLQYNKEWYIDAFDVNSGLGRYANDAYKSEFKNNARFSVNYKTRRVTLRATCTILPGSEILVPYGLDYWRFRTQMLV